MCEVYIDVQLATDMTCRSIGQSANKKSTCNCWKFCKSAKNEPIHFHYLLIGKPIEKARLSCLEHLVNWKFSKPVEILRKEITQNLLNSSSKYRHKLCAKQIFVVVLITFSLPTKNACSGTNFNRCVSPFPEKGKWKLSAQNVIS